MRDQYVEIVAIDVATEREFPEEVVNGKSYVVAEAGEVSLTRNRLGPKFGECQGKNMASRC